MPNKIYLLGGSDIRKGDSEELDKKVLSELGDSPTVSVLSWASEDPESAKSKEWQERYGEYFTRLGAKEVETISVNDSLETIKDKIGKSEVLYIAGGITEELMRHIREKGIADTIKEFKGTIVGNSAGALCLCKEVISMPNEERNEIFIEQGLGIIDFSVEVHYKETVDDELLKLSKDRKIYAIPENEALVVDGERLSEFGNGIYLFENGEKVKFENNENQEFKIK